MLAAVLQIRAMACCAHHTEDLQVRNATVFTNCICHLKNKLIFGTVPGDLLQRTKSIVTLLTFAFPVQPLYARYRGHFLSDASFHYTQDYSHSLISLPSPFPAFSVLTSVSECRSSTFRPSLTFSTFASLTTRGAMLKETWVMICLSQTEVRVHTLQTYTFRVMLTLWLSSVYCILFLGEKVVSFKHARMENA